MTPSDSRARRVAEYLLSRADEAVQHEWVGSSMLAIDNRTVLHARGSADDEPDRTMYRMAVRLPKDDS
jgi:alpha-ketoglutarate-dependent taurine dioxygenase